MSNDKSDKKWVKLNSGNLIIFLHHHLPFLQANTKVEWNALGGFFKLLDYVFAKNRNKDGIIFQMSKKQMSKYGTGFYFNQYLEAFFLSERFYYTKKSNEPKIYFTLDYLSDFIIKVQKYLIDTLGLEEYLRPIKVDFSTLVIKKAYTATLNESNLIDEDKVCITKIMIDSNAYSPNTITENHPIHMIKNYLNTQLKSELAILKQSDLTFFYAFTERKARNVKLDKELFTFNTRKDVFKVKVLSQSRLKNKIYTKIVLDSKEVNNLLNEAISSNSLEIILYYNLKCLYVDNVNYVVYKEIKKRLYTLLEDNIIDFQGLSKSTRKKLFTGLWSYDLKAAAPTIFCELYKKYFPTKKIDTLEAYVKDRNIFRYECTDYLVKTFSMTKEKAYVNIKEVLNALFYGADILNPNSDIVLGMEEREALIDDVPNFKNFITETSELFNDLYTYFTTKYNEIDKINFNGYLIDLYQTNKNGKLQKKSKASAISHIYYYYEKEILDIVIKKYKDLTLLIHDGFIIPNRINIKELEDEIFNKLKLKVQYDEEKL